ncbi:MAG TPA: LAGLIDADG family homing endonuclease [Candidatus Limnocylindria bacterium]
MHPTHLEFAPGITAVIGPNGSGKCLRFFSRVTLADGSERLIGDMVEEALASGPVEIIDDGFIARPEASVDVVSLDPDSLRLEGRRVSAFVKRTAPPRMLRVHTRSGRVVELTPYHPLFTLDGGYVRSLRADEVRRGVHVALPRQLPLSADRASLPFLRTLDLFNDADRIRIPPSPGLAEWASSGKEWFGTYRAWADAAHLQRSSRENPRSDSGLGTAALSALSRASGESPTLEPQIRAKYGVSVRVPQALTPDVARFLGLLIAEGENIAGTARFTNSDPKVNEEYARLGEHIFGLRTARYDHPGDVNAKILIQSSQALAVLLERLFGLKQNSGSAQKVVPELLLAAPEHVQWAFLSGLFEGDSYVCVKRYRGRDQAYVEYASASQNLARGVVSLLLRLGVFATIRRKEKYASNTAAKIRRTYFSVYVYGNEQMRVLAAHLRFAGFKTKALGRIAALPAGGNPNWDVVPSATELVHQAARAAGVNVKKHRKGRSKLAAYTERRCHASRAGLLEVADYVEQLGVSPASALPLLGQIRKLAKSDVYWDEVVAVEEFEPEDRWVYDLCVDDTHNFVADNFIVHNSNVADAIRWALGENNARVLRAKKNEELIFGGSETRKALSHAEALLQLDNSSRRLPIDFTEIEVGRRLFRNGEAEYLVNRSRVRLRDLQDLLAGANLADNPFVVIGQGLVDQILALRPSDRRTVIEEAAGTRRLQLRREEALNRLRSAETEMVRVNDILREIGPRVEALRDQAAKWTEYEAIRNELRRRALRWYKASFGTTADQRAELMTKITGVDKEIERLADYVAEGESTTAGTDEDLRAARQEEERRRIGTADAASTEASARERVAGLEASLAAIAAERDRTGTALAALPGELANLRERRTRVDEEASAAARGARESADAARTAEEDASRTRVALAEARAARVETERAHLIRESDELRLGDEERSLLTRDEELAATAASLAKERSERERERSRIAADLARAREKVAEAARAAESAAERAGAARNELQRIDGDLALVRGQTAALREAVDRADAELAAREDAQELPPLPKGFAWLHERIASPDAVRVALGRAVAIAGGGASGDAQPPKGCRRIADGVAIFVAPDDATALAAATTLRAGAVIAPSGLLVLPGLARIIDPRKRAERDATTQLAGMAARLHEELMTAERAQRDVLAQRADAERRREDADKRLAAAQAARGDAEVVADRLVTTEADVRDLVRAQEASAAGIERERTELLGRRDKLARDSGVAATARNVAADVFAASERAEQIAVDAHNAASKRAEEARLQSATMEERRSASVRVRDALSEQVSATERRIAQEEERLHALVAQERESRSRLETAQHDLGRATADAKEAARSAELARERALAAEGSRRESEQRLAKARERLAELRGERGKLAVEEERASGALRLLEEQVRAELGLPEDEPLPDPASIALDDEPDEKEKTSTVAALQRLRRRLIALEPVNPLAATELAEIGQRHEFLSTQKNDLERAMTDLRSLADDLATTIAEQFSTTLQAVDREFGVFFQRLFNGGQASLRTSDDPEEPGIDIYARPPGKRIGSLAQLSGGERALTATALLLAILRVRPAPFCVLDEVDAALDERNVGRFTQALRELTDRTQFVVITHNRATIEAADMLYGVSMDDGGVSKVISLKLADLDAERERAG